MEIFLRSILRRGKIWLQNAQFSATRYNCWFAGIPSVRNAVRRCEKERKKSLSNCESPALIAELQLRLACGLGACRIPVTDPENREIRQNFGLRVVHRGLGMKR